PDADVSIDGKRVGSGIWDGQLPKGPHSVTVSHGWYIEQTQQVTLAPHRAETVRVQLERVRRVYVELTGGFWPNPTLPTIGGARNELEDDEHSGVMSLAGLRAGVLVYKGLGVDAFGGFLY